MTTAEFISHLHSLDIRLWADGDHLRCNAPKDVLTAVMQAELKDRKADLLAFLHATRSSEPPLQPISRDGSLPLSFAQQRLWFLDQLEPGSPLYNIPTSYRVSGPLNIIALQESLNEIVRRHEVLRTSFYNLQGQPIQTIAPTLSLTLPVVDLSSLPEAERELEALRLAAEETRRSFDLAQAPLLRASVLRLADEEHILLLTLHHIVSDGWSMGVLFQELSALYDAFSNGKPSPLSELPIQYADFAVWQRQWFQGEVLESQLSYWKKQLADAPAVLELPTDHPRPPAQTFHGARQSLVVPNSLTNQLKALSNQENVTLFMTLLAAFQTLLYRYTGSDNILVGSPIAGRNRTEIEGLIGFFVNTLVLRTDLSGDPSFRELLRRVRRVALEAYAHQDLPFEKLVEELQPERNLSHSPLFQVMFVLQNAPMTDLRLTGLTARPLKVDIEAAKFDLALSIVEELGSLRGVIEYNTDLFDGATIHRMIGHFQTLLENIVTEPERQLSSLPILTQAEKQQLVPEWNDTKRDYPKHKCVHELFEAQVERTPDALAVVFEDKQLTYRELNRRANQLAHHLRKLGIGPEVLVGICVERSLEMVVGQLGILKAGGAFVPFDPDYPKERLVFMLEDSQARVLLTQRQLVDELFEDKRSKIENSDPRSSILNLQPKLVCLDTDWEIIAQESDANPVSDVLPDNLAYVIYTSGSTGNPKGVPTPHSGFVNLMAWLKRVHSVTPADRATQLASPAFDASIWEVWPYLAAGASIHIVDEETRVSPLQLSQWLTTKDISICFLPTPLAEAVLEEPWPSGVALRALLTGGDKLHRSPLKTLPFRFVNKYGPTENSAVTTWAPVATGIDSHVPPPIGRPIDNNQVYVLDRHLNPVPIGVPGELFIGGDGLARGYLRRPELTAEKFIPNPFSNEPGTRLYKSGDLVRYLPDGNIEFLGRIDHQVKIRGFRIELGEIEAVVGQHPAVREVVVVARKESPSDKRLVAYVVPNQGLSPSTSELRNFLKNKLPDYMLPSTFVMLDALPLTPNGKVDRRALPGPDGSRPDLDGTFVAPRNRAEVMLAGIWAEVLKLEQVGVRDNFFELGGDSILSLQIIARANQAGLRLTPKQLFQHQTIAELATVPGTTPTIHAEQGLVTGKVPLTPIQHWFFEQECPESHHWNTAMLLEVRQALEPTLLALAMQHLLVYHDVLRLRFVRVAAGWQQFEAAPDQTLPFSRVDLSRVSESERGSVIEAAAAQLQTSLSLSDGPLLRVALFDLGAGKPGRLLIVIHHLVFDGVSWRILLEDLQTAYRQLSKTKSVKLPHKTTSFKRWAERLTEHAQSTVVQKELDYWLAQPWTTSSALPVDFLEGRPHNTMASARRVSACLSVEETRALLQDVPEVYHTQINDILLTALVQAFSRWTGSQSLLVDLEGHGREEIFEGLDLSRTAGWFTTTFPVLLSLGKPSHPVEGLKSIKEQLRRIPNRGIGYGLLRYLSRDAAIAAKLRGLPQPEVSFNYLGQFDQLFHKTSLFAWTQEASGPAHSPSGSRRHLLSINGSVIEGQLRLTWIYSANLHRRPTIEGLAQAFLEALRSLITHCQSLHARNQMRFTTAAVGPAALRWTLPR
jgi:amino acid adenylation domain-containing protein/non-ribosomal peptide synthase protein (TIGR01720 family)